MIRKINSIMKIVVIALFIIPTIPISANALPAFPGAEGFGSDTIGGRGGTVLFVTNKNNSGSGSFRAALVASGPRIVVFKTGGTITLTSDIRIDNPYLTIAGQTAPGGGIQIRGPSGSSPAIYIRTHDVIIRGLRIREQNRSAIIALGNGTGNVYNIIIDHNSFSFHEDTVLGTWEDPYNMTFSWNIIAYPSGTWEGSSTHQYGFLVGGYDGCQDAARNITIHHNLFAHNRDRNPLIKQACSAIELINNLSYNYYVFGGRTFSESAWVKNHFIPGNGSQSGDPLYVRNGGECPSLQSSSVFVSENIGPGRLTNTGDDWNIVNGGTSSYRTNSWPFTPSGVTEDDVEDVKTNVLAGAGATVPSRDSVDTRIVNDVNNGTGNFIDSPSQVGGWPTLASGSAPTDSDGDGIPNAWETGNGLNPNNSSDAVSNAPSGYMWIEEYINSLIPFVAPPPPSGSLMPAPPSNLSIQ